MSELVYFVAYENDDGLHNDSVMVRQAVTSIEDIRYIERVLRREQPEFGMPVVLYYQLLSGAGTVSTPPQSGDGVRQRSRAPRRGAHGTVRRKAPPGGLRAAS